jgi:hypothetical protein
MRTKQTPQPTKARKPKKSSVEPSQATIARREKKALVASQQLEALEKHREEIAEVQSQPPPFDAANEVKALRGMVGTCLAQLAALEKVVVGLQVKVHKVHLNQDPGLSEAETIGSGEDDMEVEPESSRIDRIFCENLSTPGSILEVLSKF